MIRKQFTITGKVQGVWFRASTREQALKLGLCGYAGNLCDGSVEVQVQGSAEALELLEQWLQRGPELSKVTQVDVVEIKLQPSDKSFRIL